MNRTSTKTKRPLHGRLVKLCFALLFLFVQKASFAQPVDLFINPAISTVTVGQTFTVDVQVDFTAPGSFNVIDVFLQFNNLDLEVVSAPTVPAAVTTTLLPGLANDFSSVATMNSTGRIEYSRFNSGGAGTYPSNDFVYFSVTFRVLRVPAGGTTSITFASDPGDGLFTGAYLGASTVTDELLPGVVNVSAGACSGSIVNAGSCNGNVTLALNTATGTGPFDLVVNGVTYNNIAVGGTFTPPPTTETLNGDDDPPAGSSSFDDPEAGVTLGLIFQSSQPGLVRGLRLYSSNAPTGTYSGQLYRVSDQALLGSVVFNVTSGSDWFEVLFTTPVAINANTNYLISYFTSDANYRVIPNDFTGGFTNGNSLTIANLGARFGYAGSPVYPTSLTNNNYLIDVLFTPTTVDYELTSITDAIGCVATGTPLQTLSVTFVDCSTLPVTLLNLSASPQDNKITLRWSTTSELNNTGFRIQRSVEAGNARWEDIGFVAGAGTTSATSNYSYVDNNLSPRRYYYRLMQIDIDGQAKFTPVVSATINGKGESLLEQNFPNPFRNETTTIRFTLPRTTQVMLSVFDMNGRLVKVLVNGKKDAGTHAIPFNAGSLGSGVYYYKIQAGDFTDVKKMTIQ